jgi:hypothetical protein
MARPTCSTTAAPTAGPSLQGNSVATVSQEHADEELDVILPLLSNSQEQHIMQDISYTSNKNEMKLRHTTNHEFSWMHRSHLQCCKITLTLNHDCTYVTVYVGVLFFSTG